MFHDVCTYAYSVSRVPTIFETAIGLWKLILAFLPIRLPPCSRLFRRKSSFSRAREETETYAIEIGTITENSEYSLNNKLLREIRSLRDTRINALRVTVNSLRLANYKRIYEL